ncbi:PaaD-like zinc ribbon domain-containing protein [Domibacillus epiphyticus]|uniref:PaaD-like zinc ribbon domain-containing protein n=1 Tax=Domibacillus epiphyticus TaxID=1714355 RepID=UPI0018E9C742|nr:hypothetical protein [Domibacillus epiphyticus]
MVKEQDKAHCPFCDSEDVALMSSFGSAQLVRQFYCHECSSAFEFIKWRETDLKEGEV